jgi:hypothetical protein
MTEDAIAHVESFATLGASGQIANVGFLRGAESTQ